MLGSRASKLTIVLVVIPLVMAQATRAESPDSGGTEIDFGRQIRPLLADNCFACHGPDEDTREGGLRLDQREGVIAEADSGSTPIVPGEVEHSEVYARLITDDEDLRMPPPDSNKRLTPAEIELVRQWIKQGAAWQEHWSFVPPQLRALPNVANKSWLKTPVDLFVLDRLEKAGLSPSGAADKRTIIRRVTFDLTGLPPTTDEVTAFVADDSDDAYEKVVDRLLESPRYGEHMARYWLDAARYGDTHGLHLDNYREMWPYRDWVIRAFNDNLPYDQFVIKQLAGDLLPEPTDDDLIATGFNRCHVTTNEGGSITEEVFVRNVVDRVTTTGTVFLGLTFECTRCHDHKYDPLTMRDFYSMFAFFNSLDGKAMDGNAARHAPVLTLPTDEQAARLGELNKQVRQIKTEISEAVTRASLDTTPAPADRRATVDSERATGQADVTADGKADEKAAAPTYNTLDAWILATAGDQANLKKLPKPIRRAIQADDRRTPEQQQRLRDYFVEHAFAGTRDQFAALHQRLAAAEKALKEVDQQIASTLIYREVAKPRTAYVLHRGEYDQRRDEVPRATPAVLPPLPQNAPLNRLGVAEWLVSGNHPLTARVTVNRLWQQVYGTGLVKTSEDFGSQGEPPSHPELLDWLAIQFVNDGWDVKAMMKRLVMSATYRQASRTTAESAARDLDNRLYSRGPRFRLDAEMLRDQALAVSGLLVNKLGGPGVKPPQPDGLWHAVGYSGSNTVRFVADQRPDQVHRRTIYTFIKRTAPPPQMGTFDAPSRELCTVRRERTNTPLQALLLMNDPQYVEAARALAARVLNEAASINDRIDLMFQLCTARPPHDSERTELASVVEDHRQMFRSDPASARALAGAAENDVTDASDLAAWTMAANLMLNLDEVVTKN